MSTIDFSNRVAIVTGAGGGLGRSYALDAFGCVDVLINNAGTLRNADFDQVRDRTGHSERGSLMEEFERLADQTNR